MVQGRRRRLARRRPRQLRPLARLPALARSAARPGARAGRKHLSGAPRSTADGTGLGSARHPRRRQSPLQAPSPINYLAVRLKAARRWRYQPPAGHDVGWVALARGRLVGARARRGRRARGVRAHPTRRSTSAPRPTPSSCWARRLRIRTTSCSDTTPCIPARCARRWRTAHRRDPDAAAEGRPPSSLAAPSSAGPRERARRREYEDRNYRSRRDRWRVRQAGGCGTPRRHAEQPPRAGIARSVGARTRPARQGGDRARSDDRRDRASRASAPTGASERTAALQPLAITSRRCRLRPAAADRRVVRCDHTKPPPMPGFREELDLGEDIDPRSSRASMLPGRNRCARRPATAAGRKVPNPRSRTSTSEAPGGSAAVILHLRATTRSRGATVVALVEEPGFAAVDLGSLADGGRDTAVRRAAATALEPGRSSAERCGTGGPREAVVPSRIIGRGWKVTSACGRGRH